MAWFGSETPHDEQQDHPEVRHAFPPLAVD